MFEFEFKLVVILIFHFLLLGIWRSSCFEWPSLIRSKSLEFSNLNRYLRNSRLVTIYRSQAHIQKIVVKKDIQDYYSWDVRQVHQATMEFCQAQKEAKVPLTYRVGQQCRLEQSRLQKITIPTIIVKIMSTTVIPTLMPTKTIPTTVIPTLIPTPTIPTSCVNCGYF